MYHRTTLKDNDEMLYGGRYCGGYRYHGAWNFMMEFKSNLELPFKITHSELTALLEQEKRDKEAFWRGVMDTWHLPSRTS